MHEQNGKQPEGQALATVGEAMRFLNVSRATLYNLFADGTVPYVKLRNSRRVPWKALHAIVESAITAD